MKVPLALWQPRLAAMRFPLLQVEVTCQVNAFRLFGQSPCDGAATGPVAGTGFLAAAG